MAATSSSDKGKSAENSAAAAAAASSSSSSSHASPKGNGALFIHRAPWAMYGLTWCMPNARSGGGFRLAASSFVEKYVNRIQILEAQQNSNVLRVVSEIEHTFPITKLLGRSEKPQMDCKELLASTGDFLRIWNIQRATSTGSDPNSAHLEHCFNHSRSKDSCPPVTSCDWNNVNTNLIGTCSIDTTITIWDINSPTQPKTQLIAHDSEVYDMAFGPGPNDFASGGADGSLRLFDLRSLDTSTIVYEPTDLCPLVRVAWNPVETNYIAVLPSESSFVALLDIRYPSRAFAELCNPSHKQVNAMSWSYHLPSHLCTVGDDSRAHVWDVSTPGQPVLSYTPMHPNSSASVSQVQWSAGNPDWVAMIVDDQVHVVNV